MSIGTIPLSTTRRATLDDLAKVDGKAELINGKIVHQMATGYEPNRTAFPNRPQSGRPCRDDRSGRGFHRQHGIRHFRTSLGSRVLFPGCFLLRRPFTRKPHAVRPGSADFCRRGEKRVRLRRSGRKSDGRQTSRLLPGRNPGCLGCGSSLTMCTQVPSRLTRTTDRVQPGRVGRRRARRTGLADERRSNLALMWRAGQSFGDPQ